MPKKGTIEEIKAYKRENYLKNKEKNKEKRRLYSKIYKEANKERAKKLARIRYLIRKAEGTNYYALNAEKVKAKIKNYRKLHPEFEANRQRRRRKNPFYKFKDNIRTRIRNSFTNGFTKKSKAFTILECSYEEFRSYIESKFEPWMNWQNYGNWNGYPKEINISWDLDHIIPISNASSEEDIIALNHYTNFQPLCSYTNRYIKAHYKEKSNLPPS